MKTNTGLFERIISPENLFAAWDTFKRDKRNKHDVMRFEWRLEENIFELHRDLVSGAYRHGPYRGFYISDPKQRHIHKAMVRDRVLHHAIFSALNPIFEETFISTSFSCRVGYGTHKGVAVLERMTRLVARNGTRSCFALKCDIQKFFDSVDHGILVETMKKRIRDDDALWLLREVIGSYESKSRERERESKYGRGGKGIPIGNLTSQLFANVYMNEFDQFVKHALRVKHYVRYTDDFILAADKREYLESLLAPIREFLWDRLALELHPKKVNIQAFHRGVDFLGYIIFPKHRPIRTKTKRRILKKMRLRIQEQKTGVISRITLEQSLQSYLGALSHADGYQLSEQIKNQFWFDS